ncbi:T9SS type A sorting domain-containing protein, partial [Arthrospira platensis SPKY1]|nr:T9SS type A sorting domain-containing protein [Arthrospira platensis SPKY1]
MKVDPGNLNIGFDAVNNSKQYLFYNIDGNWQNSQLDGALMIRPAFGSGKFIGLDEANDEPSISHYPNPANNSLHFQLNNNNVFPEIIELVDLTGRTVLKQNWSKKVDISTIN